MRALFLEALDLPESERERWLDAHCADDPETRDEVRSLLVANAGPRDDLLSRGSSVVISAVAASMANEAAPPAEGMLIGPYVILREIGAGGMGRVFLAQRGDGQYQRQVALKLIRDDLVNPELLRRFLRERDTLAGLVHPNIATLLDGGVEGNAPYFTMEYVEGDPIDAWCDARKLDIRARIALVVRICDAVQYAHRNLIVHRDIKPSNILVRPDGEPKLLDFGIAKPLGDASAGPHTATTLHPMTREYAAPEQVLGEPITIATDEYALGVLLYRVLAGRMPYPRAERGEISWVKAIVEETPEPLDRAVVRASPGHDGATIAAARALSVVALRRALRGDPDNIVQRALAKSPDARYPTVGAMADDLRAYLDGRALSGGTRTYRARKFVQRYWLPLAAGLAVLVGASGIAFESHQRQLAAEQALREARAGAAVKDFLLGLFKGADPRLNGGKPVTVRELLDKGVQHVDDDLGAQPALKAEIKATLGGIYYRLGLYPEAAKLEEEALPGLDAAGDQARLAANAIDTLARTARENGDPKRAEELLDEEIRRLDAMPSPSPADLAHALYMRVFMATDNHNPEEALRYANRAVAIARTEPENLSLIGDMLQGRASAYQMLRRYDDAEADLREAVELHTKAGPKARTSLGSDRESLAFMYSETERYEQAVAMREPVRAMAREIMGERHPYVLHLDIETARDLHALGRDREARQRFEQALAVQRETLAADSYYIAETLDGLGAVLEAIGNDEAAAAAYTEARDIWTRLHGPEYSHVLYLKRSLAEIELRRGHAAEAEQALRDVLRAREPGHDEGDAAVDRARLADAERALGKHEAAVEDARAAVASALASNGEHSSEAATTRCSLGLALAETGHADEAAQLLRQVIGYYDGIASNGDHPRAASARLDLAGVLASNAASKAEAIELATAAVHQRERLFGETDPLTKSARDTLTKLGSHG
ncbi:MAG TPA: serine/threonine-protein kinase [Rhodanobacteraceae bacterium]|nr:serine/threonine-protein kinase [Rhodanobacteraceae bacterium]